jgi:DNA-binding MarR family transcriptional regulator
MAGRGVAVPKGAMREPGTKKGTLKGVAGGAEGPLEVDRVIHERVRLAIVSVLAVHRSQTFAELKRTLDLTDGNLSVHARKLEEAGYVECLKGFEGRVPRTVYRLTPQGRKALKCYLDHMEALVKALGGKKRVGEEVRK